MPAIHCSISGNLTIDTPHGRIRCVGSGSTFEITFQNLRQLITTGRPVRRGPLWPMANSFLAATRHAGIDVQLRIGERIVADVFTGEEHATPRVKLRFLNLAVAAIVGSESPGLSPTLSGQREEAS